MKDTVETCDDSGVYGRLLVRHLRISVGLLLPNKLQGRVLDQREASIQKLDNKRFERINRLILYLLRAQICKWNQPGDY